MAEDCATVLAGDALSACVKEAIAILSPSQEGTGFCANFEAASEKCSHTFDKADCYAAAKTLNDATLGLAQQCFRKSCADIALRLRHTLAVENGRRGCSSSRPRAVALGRTTDLRRNCQRLFRHWQGPNPLVNGLQQLCGVDGFGQVFLVASS